MRPGISERKRSAALGLALFGLIQAGCAAVFAWLCAIPGLPRWLFALFAALAAACAGPMLPALWALRERFQELDALDDMRLDIIDEEEKRCCC